MNKKILGIVAFSCIVAFLASSIAINAASNTYVSTFNNPTGVTYSEIRALVISSKTGTPLSGAIVTARQINPNGPLYLFVSMGGGYYYGQVPAGEYIVTASKLFYGSNSVDIKLPDGVGKDVTISLTPRFDTTVTGTVIEPTLIDGNTLIASNPTDIAIQ